jgi:hypothetical protein
MEQVLVRRIRMALDDRYALGHTTRPKDRIRPG